jgi:addiction module HigA family antidote
LEINMPRSAIHPGEHLARELEEHGMSAAELARRLRVSIPSITGILTGHSAITIDMAVRFAHVFGPSARFWRDLQEHYDLARKASSPAADNR